MMHIDEKKFKESNPGIHKVMMSVNHNLFFELVSIDGIDLKGDVDLSKAVVFKDSNLDNHTFYYGNEIIPIYDVVPPVNVDETFVENFVFKNKKNINGNYEINMFANGFDDKVVIEKLELKRIKNIKYIKDNALIMFTGNQYPNGEVLKYSIVLGYIDDKGMWVGHQGISTTISGGGNPHKIDSGLIEGFPSIFEDGSSVVDFGCGNADYIKRLISDGFKCEAYDGNPITPKMTDGIGKVLDLSKKFNLNKKFDYVISIEVAEHIPKEYEEIYVDNLIRHTGYYLITSWAIKGQGGDGHVNEQDEDYVLDLYKKKGMVYQKEISEALRSVAILGWFKETIYVFGWE